MESESLSRIMAGTISGWAVVTVGQPLDYLKTMYQIKDHHVPSLLETYKSIGIQGFYKGASSIYLFVSAVTALQFSTFQQCSDLLKKYGMTNHGNPTIGCLMLSGFLTGILCSFIYTPTQYAKILCQIQHRPPQGSVSIIASLLYNQKIQGLKKLYTGNSITLVKQSFGSAIYYGGYYVLLTKLFQQERETANIFSQSISGSISGMLYQLYAYPFDTIKTNIQSGKKSFREMIDNKFWKAANFKNGLKLSLLRNLFVDAINFSVYENLRKLFLSKSSKKY